RICGAADGERQASAVACYKARSDAAQWFDDATHRPPPQRRVAGDEGSDRMSGENAEEEPSRGPGIAEIEQVLWFHEPADPDPVDRPAAVVDPCRVRPEGVERRGGRQHILALQQTRDFGLADGERPEH